MKQHVALALRLVLAALVAVPVAIGLNPNDDRSTAEAALQGLTAFEIDGNTTGARDWTTAPDVFVENDFNYTGPATVPATVTNPAWIDNCPGGTDDLFKQSTNIDDPNWTGDFETGNQVNNKQDICQSLFSYEVVPSGARAGHVIAYLAFTRRAANGDGSYYFLLSKGSNPDVRVAGDVVIEVDYDGQGNPQGVRVAEWAGAGTPSLGTFTAVGTNNANIQVAPIAYFAEMAIDLTQLGLADNAFELSTPAACQAFAYGRVISRTGNSPTATLKDDGQPAQLDFDVCGRVEIAKALTAAVPSASSFPATLNAPAGVTLPYPSMTLTVPAGSTTGGTADDGNQPAPNGNPVVYASVPPRPSAGYSVSEVLTAALDLRWDLQSIVCVNDKATASTADDVTVQTTTSSTSPSFIVLTNETVRCTITNAPAPARIDVTKDVTPDGAGGTTTWPINLTGRPSQQVAEDGTVSFTGLAAGSYTLSETDPANVPGQPPFDVVGWSCQSGTDPAVQVSGASIGLTVNPGDAYACTVQNAQIPAPQIAVTKTVIPTSFPEPSGSVTYSVLVGNPGSTAITVTALSDSVTKNGGSATVLDLAAASPGSAAGGTVTANTCDDLVVGQTIAAGGQLGCSFTVAHSGLDSPDRIDDVVTATGTDVFGRTVQDDDDARVDVTNRPPVLTVTKSNVQPDTLVAPGGLATYSVDVVNGPDAVEAVTITAVADAFTRNGAAFGGAVDITAVGGAVTATTCTALLGTVLAPGATASCQFVVDTTVLGALAQDDELENTVTVTAVDDEGTPVVDDDDAARDVLGAPPAMAVRKSDAGAVISEPSGDVTYAISIANLGTTEALTIDTIVDTVRLDGAARGAVTITDSDAVATTFTAPAVVSSTLTGGVVLVDTTCDDLIGDVLLEAASVVDGWPTNAAATASCTITLTLPANAGAEYDDTAQVLAFDETGDPVDGDADEDTPAVGVLPVVLVDKTADPVAVPETGGVVTFDFVITNDSVTTDPITLTSLVDDRFGDLFDATLPLDGPLGADVVSNDCHTLDGVVLAPGDSVSCAVVATIDGNVGQDHTNTVVVTAVDDEGATDSDQDDATVAFTDVAPVIEVTKTADPTTVSEFGGTVTYDVVVDNLSDEPVTTTSLLDDRFGDLTTLDATTCVLGVEIAAGGSYSCEFSAFVAQQGTELDHVNVVTAKAVDDEGTEATDDDDAVVTFELIPPTVDITKIDGEDGLATVTEPGGDVEYTLTIENTSAEPVVVTELKDVITYEIPVATTEVDLLAATPGAPVVSSTCLTALTAVSFQLAASGQPGDSLTCSFVVSLAGTAQIVRDVASVTVVDFDQQPADDEDDEATPILDVLPAVEIVKTADPTVIEPGQDVTYTFVIRNLSPVEALTLSSLTDDKFTIDAADCDIAGRVLAPDDGEGGGADEYVCDIVRTLTEASESTHTNVATVVGTDDEGNEATDDDDASVLTLAKSSITVVKDADPAGTDERFTFVLADLAPVELAGADDPSTPSAVENAHVFDRLDAGDYALSELVADDDWELTGATCVDTSDGGDVVPFDNGDTLTLGWDQHLTCTFSNTQDGTITVRKETLPDGSAEQFAFDVSWAGDDVLLADGDQATASLQPGEYSVTELVPSGWDLDGVTCTVAGDSSYDVEGAEVTIDLVAGDSVDCTYTNVQRGEIVVNKLVDGEDDGEFDFSLTPGDAFSITTVDGVGTPWSSGDIVPGSYVLTETDAGAAFDATGLTCSSSLDDDEQVEGIVASIELDPGEVVTCTFTNTQKGEIRIDKVTVPAGDETEFAFDPSWSTTNVLVADGDTPASSGLLSANATYTVTELVDPAAWVLSDLVCTSSQGRDDEFAGATATVELQPAEVVTCTFTNIARGPVTVDKAITSGPTQQAGTNRYDVTYSLTVENESYVDETFSFADSLGLAGGVEVVGTPVVSDDAVVWDAATASFAVTDEPIAANATVVYTIAVTVRVPGATSADERACDPELAEDGGTLNSVSLTSSSGSPDEDAVCEPLPESAIDMDKALVEGASRAADGTWTIVYRVDVENTGDGPGQYDLDDELAFGGSAAVQSVSVVASSEGQTDPAAPAGPITSTLAGFSVADVEIVAGAAHHYLVTVTARIDAPVPGDGACDVDGVDAGGFLNTAVLSEDGEPVDREFACDEFSTLTLVKDLVNDDGGDATLDDFVLTAADSDDSVVVQGTGSVIGAVEPGTYFISESEQDGYAASPWSCTVEGGETELVDQLAAVLTAAYVDEVSVPAGGDAECTITNDDLPVDLELTKDDGGVTAVAGGAPFPYTITVQNVGPRAVDLDEPVVVTDVLPSAFTWVTVPAGCATAGQVLTCELDPALFGVGSDPVVIVASVRATPDAPSGTYVNKAFVTTDDDPACEGEGCEPPCPEVVVPAAVLELIFDEVDAPNVDCEPTPVDRTAGITVTKTDDVEGSVEAGDPFTYAISVRNDGPSTVTTVTLADDLPAGLTLLGVDAGAGWTCNAVDPIACTYASALAPGASTTTVTVTVQAAASLAGTSVRNVAVGTATVDEPGGETVTDEDDETTPVTYIPSADLSIVKSASVAVAERGGTFVWVLDVQNLGPDAATNVVVGDVVPAPFTVVGVASSSFACAANGNAVNCTVASLASGATGQVRITVSVPADAASGFVTNIGTVQAATPDPNLLNNSDDARVEIPVVAVAPPLPEPAPQPLPATGTSLIPDLMRIGVGLLVVGFVILVSSRRRGSTPT